MSSCYLKGVLAFSRNPQKSHFLTVLVVRSCFKYLGAVDFEPSCLHSFTVTSPVCLPEKISSYLTCPELQLTHERNRPPSFLGVKMRQGSALNALPIVSCSRNSIPLEEAKSPGLIPPEHIKMIIAAMGYYS